MGAWGGGPVACAEFLEQAASETRGRHRYDAIPLRQVAMDRGLGTRPRPTVTAVGERPAQCLGKARLRLHFSFSSLWGSVNLTPR